MNHVERIIHSHFTMTVPAIVALFLLAAQCSGDNPPLPSSPSGPTLRLAILSPTEGELSPVGQMMRSGVIMALDEWNKQGGIRGRRLEWTLYHTDCTFNGARQAARQAIDDGIRFIIGPICSTAAVASAVAAEPEEVITMSPTATHPLVTVDARGQTRPHSFRLSYTSSLQGRAAARFARGSLGTDRVALISEANDDYSTALAAAFAEQFLTEGGDIVYQARISPADADLTEILTKVSQSGATLIYSPTSPAVANSIARRLLELGLLQSASASEMGLGLLGSDAWASDELDLIAAEGSYFPVHYSAEAGQPLVSDWQEAYKSVYAVEPNALAALGYDTANVLLGAIRQADSFEPDDVSQILERSSFQGVTGQIEFDQFHNPLKAIPFVRVQSEQITLITTVF